jgi:hypothetical protein
MLNIKHKSVIIEIDRNDLWQLSTALINGIIMESQKKWIFYYKGNSEGGFLRYVRLQHHVIFVYLHEIFTYLEREEMLDSLEKALLSIYRQKSWC